MNTVKPVNIAICDAHTLFRQSMLLLLQSFGNFQIVANAANGPELVNQLQHTAASPDICILEVNLPRLNGYDTMLKIKKLRPETKIMILSHHQTEQSILRFLVGGAHGYTFKTCDQQELQQALTAVYQGEYYFPKNIVEKLVASKSTILQSPDLVISKNEYQFLTYCCSELSYKEIAGLMNLSLRTVEGYRDALFKKLNVRSRVGLAIYGINSGVEPLT